MYLKCKVDYFHRALAENYSKIYDTLNKVKDFSRLIKITTIRRRLNLVFVTVILIH